MKIKMNLLFILMVLSVSIGHAQENRTITVEGTKVYNLSPNEIVITIDYEEYYIEDEKVTIETIEAELLEVIYGEKINKDKLTFGSIGVIRPYDRRTETYKRPRLRKSLLICLNNTKEFASLTRAMEKEQLFDQVIRRYRISELRHTEKLDYIEKSRNEAFTNAKNKADLILSNSSNKTGQVIRIEEKQQKSAANNSFYSVDNTNQGEVSGFTPIVVSYSLMVTFEIIQ